MTISLNNVCFAYPDMPHNPVLNIPNWSVESQEHLFIYGPSGVGKSTLLNLLSGVIVSTAGEVLVLGERLDKMSHRQRDRFRANHIGYVFQQFNLIPYLNAVENIQLATHFSKRQKTNLVQQDIEALLGQLNISAGDRYKPTAKLSTGQQQRVAIARALINKPEILIADEPTSSLDQENRDNFMAELMSLVDENDITLIFVSHDKSLSQYFSRIEALSDISHAGGDA